MSERTLPALVAAGLTTFIVLLLLGTVYGSVPLEMGQVVRALAGQVVAGVDHDVPLTVSRIVLDLRLPRVVLAACVGCGLASVGVLLQTTTRNDLADPFLFGLSSGAAAGAVAVITMLGDALGVWTLPVATFAGAALSATAVLSLVARHQDQGPERLIIAGLAVSFLFGALTSFMVFAGDQRAAYSILFWSVGGLGLASWGNLPLAVIGAGLAVGTGLMNHWRLDALLAGDETAASLGIDVRRLRRIVFIMAALATACLVALSGVIGFVGLMVPHLARAVVGVRHKRLVLGSALLGAIFLLAGDIVSRTIMAPQELPVGVITAAAGGVFVLALVMRRTA